MTQRLILWCGLLVLLFGFGQRFSAAQDLTIAAAADLQFAMPDIASRFQKETGKNVRVVYGSSGNFFEQIENGAPFDMFFSANLDYAKRLESAGLVEPTSYEYAEGKLVIWAPTDSKLSLTSGLSVLLDPSVKKIAIANPEHAPYGQAAVAAMKKANIYGKIKDKLVLGENISQAASFVATGAADVGILALSLAVSPGMKEKGRYAEIPEEDYPAIQQACVILNSSKNKKEAEQFLEFIKTPAIGSVLQSYGFAIPASPSGASNGR